MNKNTRRANIAILMITFLSLLIGCEVGPSATSMDYKRTQAFRESKIPAHQVKITPATDLMPPILHSSEYEKPVPMPYPINTAGAEDSGFIMPDGNTFYLFFTPDPNIPVEKQLTDEVTGIWVSRKIDGVWQPAERVLLQDPKKLSLDGCEFIQGNTMWFATVRTGYTGIHWFTAQYINGQ